MTTGRKARRGSVADDPQTSQLLPENVQHLVIQPDLIRNLENAPCQLDRAQQLDGDIVVEKSRHKNSDSPKRIKLLDPMNELGQSSR